MRRERRRTVAMIVRQQRGGGWPQYRSTSCVRADVDERGGGRAGRRGTTIGTGNGWTAGIQDGCGRKGPARTRQRVRGWGRFCRSAARASPDRASEPPVKEQCLHLVSGGAVAGGRGPGWTDSPGWTGPRARGRGSCRTGV